MHGSLRSVRFIFTNGPKIVAEKSLVSRAMRICSASELDGELAIVRSSFVNYGFPTAVID